MALAANSRGAGSTNTGGQSTLVITPTSNSAAWPGSMMFLCVACDNSGASGVSPLNTITDSLNNIWNPDFNAANSAANNANDGVVLIGQYCWPKIGLTTADTITVDFGGITTVARAWTLTEITCAAGKYVVVSPGGAGGGSASGSSTTPSVTEGSAVVSGDCVLGSMAAQGNATITADSDTLNGNWSTQQTSGVGAGAAGVEVATQNKVVTGTTAQVYNTTITSALWVARIRATRETALPAYLTRHDQPRQTPIVRAGFW